MKVNQQELFTALEASLKGFLPLPDELECIPGWADPGLALGRFRHGDFLGWREVVEVAQLWGFEQQWVLLPFCGGRVALAQRGSLTAHQQLTAQVWQTNALPVLAVLAKIRDSGLET